MNKRQYKKIRKTKTEKEFFDFLKKTTKFHMIEKDKFYIFQINRSIDCHLLSSLGHFVKYLKSTGVHFGFIPNDILVINEYNNEKDYLDYLKNMKNNIETIISGIENKEK